MVEQDQPDLAFDAMTSRLSRREALRRAAKELNTTSVHGLENVVARISAEVTAEASTHIADRNASAIFPTRSFGIEGKTSRSAFDKWNSPQIN